MAAFDNINYAALADKFQKFYDIFNATMTALKAGVTNSILTSTGAGSAPTFQAVWSDWTIVDGSLGLNAAFVQESDDDLKLKIRKSVILNMVEVSGGIIATGAFLTPNASVPLFNLPVGYRPIKSIFDNVTKSNASGVAESQITALFDISAVVFINNSSAYTSFSTEPYYFNTKFPLS